MRKIILILFSTILLFACKPQVQNTPESVANNFVKQYYQDMNQEEAIKYSSMMAKDKLEKEIGLVKESRIRNPQPAENRAKVSYKLEDTKIDKDMGYLTYNLTIQPTGASLFEREALITMQNEKGVWKVIDYEEVSKEDKPKE